MSVASSYRKDKKRIFTQKISRSDLGKVKGGGAITIPTPIVACDLQPLLDLQPPTLPAPLQYMAPVTAEAVCAAMVNRESVQRSPNWRKHTKSSKLDSSRGSDIDLTTLHSDWADTWRSMRSQTYSLRRKKEESFNLKDESTQFEEAALQAAYGDLDEEERARLSAQRSSELRAEFSKALAYFEDATAHAQQCLNDIDTNENPSRGSPTSFRTPQRTKNNMKQSHINYSSPYTTTKSKLTVRNDQADISQHSSSTSTQQQQQPSTTQSSITTSALLQAISQTASSWRQRHGLNLSTNTQGPLSPEVKKVLHDHASHFTSSQLDALKRFDQSFGASGTTSPLKQTVSTSKTLSDHKDTSQDTSQESIHDNSSPLNTHQSKPRSNNSSGTSYTDNHSTIIISSHYHGQSSSVRTNPVSPYSPTSTTKSKHSTSSPTTSTPTLHLHATSSNEKIVQTNSPVTTNISTALTNVSSSTSGTNGATKEISSNIGTRKNFLPNHRTRNQIPSKIETSKNISSNNESRKQIPSKSETNKTSNNLSPNNETRKEIASENQTNKTSNNLLATSKVMFSSHNQDVLSTSNASDIKSTTSEFQKETSDMQNELSYDQSQTSTLTRSAHTSSTSKTASKSSNTIQQPSASISPLKSVTFDLTNSAAQQSDANGSITSTDIKNQLQQSNKPLNSQTSSKAMINGTKPAMSLQSPPPANHATMDPRKKDEYKHLTVELTFDQEELEHATVQDLYEAVTEMIGVEPTAIAYKGTVLDIHSSLSLIQLQFEPSVDVIVTIHKDYNSSSKVPI